MNLNLFESLKSYFNMERRVSFSLALYLFSLTWSKIWINFDIFLPEIGYTGDLKETKNNSIKNEQKPKYIKNSAKWSRNVLTATAKSFFTNKADCCSVWERKLSLNGTTQYLKAEKARFQFLSTLIYLWLVEKEKYLTTEKETTSKSTSFCFILKECNYTFKETAIVTVELKLSIQ